MFNPNRDQLWQETLDAIPERKINMGTSMTFNDFSIRNRQRCEHHKGFNHSLHSWSTSDWMTATMGELGEAANVIKKLNRVRDGIPGNVETEEQLKTKLADEIADTFIYLDLLAQSLGLRMDEIVFRKFQRTSKKIGFETHQAGCICQACLAS